MKAIVLERWIMDLKTLEIYLENALEEITSEGKQWWLEQIANLLEYDIEERNKVLRKLDRFPIEKGVKPPRIA